MSWDVDAINQALSRKTPEEIIRWAVENANGRVVCSTNFRPKEAVILHMVTQVMPAMPILWADTGYATPETYRFADALSQSLKLHMHVFNPGISRARWESVYGDVPTIDDVERHDAFTEVVKIEPFFRGLNVLKPNIWITAIRRGQTSFRDSLDVASMGPFGILKISPVYSWTDEDMDEYLAEHGLPDETEYFDPTKVESNRECGLHIVDGKVVRDK
ncbi:MAG: phosphoadenylylsulfate reductase [Myxococcales bacterium]|nr:phosphoadenylylsulfate reductase [Myxococcales bacterium]|tara:strand:+ start:170 stop:820 length:651 start_codon:yes stop_codon:yes gene_type:complete